MNVCPPLGGPQRGALYGPAVVAPWAGGRVCGTVPIRRCLPRCVRGSGASLVEMWEGEPSPPRRASITKIFLWKREVVLREQCKVLVCDVFTFGGEDGLGNGVCCLNI